MIWSLILVPSIPVFPSLRLFSVEPGYFTASIDDSKSREKSAVVSIDAPHDFRSELSIQRGIAYLVKHQNGVGSFSSSYPLAVTSLGGMALLAGGVEYGVGKEGKALERAVDYLTAAVRSDGRGYLQDRGATRSRMHGHSYAITFLSQVAGQLPTPLREQRLREVIRSGVNLMLSCQTLRGGWGYEPDDPLDEASLTVCCLQALRSAKDSGIAVPAEPIARAVKYLKECCSEDGSFRYSLSRGTTKTSFEMTAAALSTLDAAGEFDIEERRRGMDFLRRSILAAGRSKKGAFQSSRHFPFYGNFYTGQVLQQTRGELWNRWTSSVWPRVLQLQKKDGSWESRFGDEYGTAMSLLILELPLGYLPLYDR
ncbi:MAG: hypothetical protein OSB09_07500 [Planctomycetota bacterium]|nr:hypothetical protein [Planctomycetota bacterium]